jgi:hypothetical protein
VNARKKAKKYAYLEIAFVMSSLLGTHLLSRIRSPLCTHNASKSSAAASLENFGVWSQNFNDRFACVDTTGSPLEATRRFVGAERRAGLESISSRKLWTFAIIASNCVLARSSGFNVTLRNKDWTGSFVVRRLQSALIDVVDNHATSNSNIRWGRPGSSNCVVHMELANIGQTTVRQRDAVRNSQRTEVVFRILIQDIHSILFIKISLSETKSLVAMRIVAKLQDWCRFIHAAVSIVVVNKSRLAGANWSISRS